MTTPALLTTDETRRSAKKPERARCCLLHIPCGQKLRVEELTGSPPVRSRLYSLGILPGTEMEVWQNCNESKVCVRVRDCSLVLGEGMARAVLCCPLEEHEMHESGLACMEADA